MQSNILSIKTEKLVVDGCEHYKIVSIAGMNRDSLPKKYFDKSPYCYMYDGEMRVIINSVHKCQMTIKVKDIISIESFEVLSKIIQTCCDKLKNINKEIADMKEEWSGEKTIIFK